MLPSMLRRGAGAIVNVASQLGQTGMADYATYCATKFGVGGFTEALADELAGTGVSVHLATGRRRATRGAALDVTR